MSQPSCHLSFEAGYCGPVLILTNLFVIQFEKGIYGYKDEQPAVVLVSSAAVERNALVGDDQEARKKDIPIVQLNPGGILNYKYKGEMALRNSGLPYCVVRPVGKLHSWHARPSMYLSFSEFSHHQIISGKEQYLWSDTQILLFELNLVFRFLGEQDLSKVNRFLTQF